MAEIPGYEVKRVLLRSPVGDAAVVALPDGGERLLRTVRVEPLLAGAEGPFARAARFFASLKRQQRVAAATAGREGSAGAGRGHVAAVHLVEATEDGGRALLDVYPLTASAMVEGRVALADYALYEVVAGVVHALGLIAEAEHGRAHGALRAAAVEIDASAGPGRWRVGLGLLAPPAEADADGDRARLEDLRGVGRLIYELVEHRPFRELGGYPVRDQGAWAGLAERADGWLALVNRLLDPDLTPGRLRLSEVAEQVSALAARPPRTKQRVQMAVGVGLPLLIALVAGGVYLGVRGRPAVRAPFDREKFIDWCEAYEDWYQLFTAVQLKNGPLRELAGRDPHLGDVVRLVEGGLKADVRFIDPMAAVKTVTSIQEWPADRRELLEALEERAGVNPRVERVLSTAESGDLGGQIGPNLELVRSILDAIDVETWPKRKELAGLAAAWRDRGWAEAAAWAAGAAGVVTPDEGNAEEFAGELKRVVEAHGMTVDAVKVLAEIDARCDAIASAGASAEGGGVPADEVLTNVRTLVDGVIAARLAGASPADATSDDRAITALQEAVADLAGQTEDIAAFVAGDDWKKVDREVFAEEAAVFAAFDPQRPEDRAAWPSVLKDWLAQAKSPGFALPDPAGDPRLGSAWTDALATLSAMKSKLADLSSRYPAEYAEAVPEYEQGFEGGFAATIGRIDAQAAGLSAERLGWRRRTVEPVQEGVASVLRELARVEPRVRALAARIEVKWEDLKPALIGERSISPRKNGAIDAAWNERKDAMIAGLDPGASASAETFQARAVELRDRTESLRAWLLAVDEGVFVAAAPTPGSTPPGFNVDALEAVVSARREEAAGRIVASASVEPSAAPGEAAATAGLAEGAAAERGWSEAVASLVERFAAVSVLLDAAFLPGEEVAGQTLGGLVASALDDPLWATSAGAGLRTALGPVAGRAEAYRRLMGEADAAALLGVAGDAGAGAAERRVAYDRLASRDEGGSSWCVAPGELAQDASAWASVRAAAAGLTDARRADVEAWLGVAGRTRFERAMSGAGSTPAAVEAVLRLMEAYGIERASLAGAARLNAELYFGLATIDQSGEDGAVRDAINAGLRSIESSGVGIPDGVRAWLNAVRVVGEPPPPGFKAVDPAEIGPAATGKWRLREPYPDDFSLLTYTHNATGIAVTFARVEGAGETSEEDLFIATEEMSIDGVNALLEGDAAGYAAAFGRADSVKSAMRNEGQEQGWDGPRSWVWDARASRFVPGGEWVTPFLDARVPQYPPELVDPSNVTRIVAGQRPSGRSPMNLVSPFGAAWLASRMGCELPSAEQWAAAYRVFAPGGTGGLNLRDATWAAKRRWDRVGFQDAFRALNNDPNALAQNEKHTSPTLLMPRTLPAGADGDPDAVHGFNDGVLWFAPVDEGGGGVVRHLRGNVAELVRFEQSPIDYGVIGDSALSHPSAAAERPVPFDRTSAALVGGSVEVGFRVSFSKTLSETAGQRLGRLIAGGDGPVPYVASGR